MNRQVAEARYAEPTTGRVYAPAEAPHGRVQAVFNQENCDRSDGWG